MTRPSRINRWTGRELTKADANLSPRQLAIVPTRMRLEAAERNASAALMTARARLDSVQRHRRKTAVLESLAGTMGLSGLVVVALVGAPQIHPAWVALFAIASAIPVLTSLRRFGKHDLAESNAVATVEQARAVALQAASLQDWFARPADTLLSMADAALADVEQAVAAVDGGQNRSTSVSNERMRRHVRIKLKSPQIVVTRSDQLAVTAQLIDVSLSGAAIRGDIPGVGIGDEVRLGSRVATIVRLLPNGIACEFLAPLEPEVLDYDIEL